MARNGNGNGFRSKGFDGNCNFCHKFGHKSVDCNLRKASAGAKNRPGGNRYNQDSADVLLIAKEMELAFMAEEQEEDLVGYCVNCGGRGPLGTYCTRSGCEDSGSIYTTMLFEEEGRGNYWEEDDEDSSGNESSDMFPDNDSDEERGATLEPGPTLDEVMNRNIVTLSCGHTAQFLEKMCRHRTGNTRLGLFDLLIIAALEFRRDWLHNEDPRVIRYATERHVQLESMGILTVEDLIKNISVVQNNLKLLGHDRFDFREFVHLHHAAVVYFMIHGGIEDISAEEASRRSVAYLASVDAVMAADQPEPLINRWYFRRNPSVVPRPLLVLDETEPVAPPIFTMTVSPQTATTEATTQLEVGGQVQTPVDTQVETQVEAQDESVPEPVVATDSLDQYDTPNESPTSEFSCYVADDISESTDAPLKKRKLNNQIPHLWIGDSGASCHMTCSDEGMFDCRQIQSSVKIGNGKTLSATKIGKKRMTVVQKDGTTTDVVLTDCKYVPELFTNLFSITNALKKLTGFYNPVANKIVHSAVDVDVNDDESSIPTDINPEPMLIADSEEGPDGGNGEMDSTLSIDESAHIIMDLSNMDYAFAAILNNGNPDSIAETSYKDVYDIPTNFNNAWNHNDKWQRSRWRIAINNELDKMKQYSVWQVVPRKTIPPNRRCVKHKWVFDIKRNGTFRARLVACGYTQIPGVDFTEAYSPVINDVAFRIMIIIQMVWKLSAKIIDVETAFLNGELEEQIYMDCPDGLEHDPNDCLLLTKALYGLVQSARQFFKKFVEILKSIGFVQSTAEPCLLVKNDDKLGIAIIAIYVDDCYAIGDEIALNDMITKIQQKGLKIKIENDLSDYLSCEIVSNKLRTKAWLGQPHLSKRLENSFSDFISTKKNYLFKTPGTPGLNMIRPKNDNEKVSPAEQTIYRSAVGTLLQFVKHSRPDLANPVRELSKCMDAATYPALKELKRIIKFVIDTKHYGLRIEPKFVKDEWALSVYTDSEDWAGDKDNRHSISGFVIFLLDVPIFWKSKAQKAIALSSSEAEYYTMAEAAK